MNKKKGTNRPKTKKQDEQTINSLNNYDVDIPRQDEYKHQYKHDYEDKYELDPDITNQYGAWYTNPTVQPDGRTEMGVPIPTEENVEYSKEYGEENQL